MKLSSRAAIFILITFFVAVFTVAWHFNRHFPTLVFAGENSVGTWMSGALLIFSAALCLSLSIAQRAFPWLLLVAFFLLLALDERFMFHERIKEWILFSSTKPSVWLYELPVITGAAFGALAGITLWRYVTLTSRVFVVLSVAFGLASVITDILAAGVVMEEVFKLFGELLIVFALLQQMVRPQQQT